MLNSHRKDLWDFSKVCALKFIVSEGEKIMIFYLTGNQDETDPVTIQQAAELGLISNLISIICRFVFQPLEEIAYNMFSKFKGKESSDATDILVKNMAGMMGIGVSAIIFSQFCSNNFILVAFSSQWATPSATKIMKSYCVYLFFMSLNGMSEAFAYGLANQKVLTQLQGLLVFNSVLYITAVLLCSSQFGIVGLIYANCLNMGVRASMSLYLSIDKNLP